MHMCARLFVCEWVFLCAHAVSLGSLCQVVSVTGLAKAVKSKYVQGTRLRKITKGEPLQQNLVEATLSER